MTPPGLAATILASNGPSVPCGADGTPNLNVTGSPGGRPEPPVAATTVATGARPDHITVATRLRLEARRHRSLVTGDEGQAAHHGIAFSLTALCLRLFS